ncbi:hypothetical protein AALP_AA7G220700 [Arabis alpina]|uniref:F-box domain-containing protein n=1 Tax=Arabis alpina TaxID=50452 RepID=A0A087GJS6_ARAAL|nr:hypothetical protein AALP_AA7G220700 [Arabis alpina]
MRSEKKKRKTTKKPSLKKENDLLPESTPNPSLPDDLLLSCFARASRLYYPTLSLASKTFRSLIASPELYQARSSLGQSESCLYVYLTFRPESPDPTPSWYTLCQKPNPTITNDTSTRKNKKKPCGYVLAKIQTPHSPHAHWSGLVAVGSNIYNIGGPIENNEASSRVLILDSRSQTWREGPRGCKGCNASNWMEVYDPESQTWELVSCPGAEIIGCSIHQSAGIDGNVYIFGGGHGHGLAYKTKEGTSEMVGWGMDHEWVWFSYNVIGNVLYYYYDGEFKWYVRSSELKNKTILCAVIALERRNNGEEMWGNVEWHDAVLTVPESYQVTKASDDAYSFRQECLEVKGKTEKLAGLLRQAARASNDLYERPTRRIIDDTEQVLFKALALVEKCRATGLMKRVFTIIPAAAFRKITMQLENSIGDVSWLLRVSASGDDRDDEYLGLPPIAANEPILCLIWEQVAILFTGSLDDRSDAAASLVSLARDNDRYGRLIIEEGGVPPLLKLAKEVFAKILKEGHMKVQTVVAWAVSELASNHPKCQDHFAQNNIIRFLTLSIHTVVMASNTNPSDKSEQDETKSQISRPTSNQTPIQMHSLVANTLAMKGSGPGSSSGSGPGSSSGSGTSKNQTKQSSQQHHNHTKGGPNPRGNNPTHVSLIGTSIKGREYEDPATKAQMKAMAARALWQLSRGNLQICRSITESRALLCFAVLLEKGDDEVKSYSALAMMEITDVAEQYPELRRSAFKPTSPAAKAVVEQLLKVIENEIPDLLIPCIKSIGSLSRTFRATETRIIGPLVKLLDEREAEVAMEASVALIKFSCTENFLRDNHSKAIIEAGGAKHLIQLVYFGEQMVQVPALVLLCYIALNVPDSETLAQEEVLVVLEWSTKQAHLVEAPTIDEILPEAKSRLELYQSRGSRGFH